MLIMSFQPRRLLCRGCCASQVFGRFFVLERLYTCERADRDCDTNPCEHGGTCQSGLAGPTCLCSAGYTGTLCERDLDECISEPCRNGALCRDGVDQYSCYCVPGYQGKHCDLFTAFSSPPFTDVQTSSFFSFCLVLI